MLQNALQVTFIANDGSVRADDYFACEDYRKLIFAAWPSSSPQLAERETLHAHDQMELTAHQLAYVDVKVSDLKLLCPSITV